MSAYKDGERWRYRFRFRGKRYGGTAPVAANTKKMAERLERTHLEKLEKRQHTGRMPTVAEFSVDFLDYQRERTAPTTQRAQASHVSVNILPHIGRLHLDDVDRKAIDKMVTAWRAAGDEPTTCNNRLTTLKTMLSMALEWRFIVVPPRVKKLRSPQTTPRFLNEDEAQRLLDAAPPKWRSMMLVALRTGLRIGELRGLMWGDVDFERRVIRVRRTDPGRKGYEANAPKGKRERTVPLTDETYAALCALVGIPGGWVWPGFTSRSVVNYDKPRSEDACIKAIGAAAVKAGIQREDELVGWHTLRHTYASWLVARGVHLSIVARLLGHASVRQTEVYAHLAPDLSLHDVVASLDFRTVSGQPTANALSSGDENSNEDTYKAPPSGVAPRIHDERRERAATGLSASTSRRRTR